ncbi:complement C1q tumor necrosis factor-related protein 2-like [Ostrea edulis]|uniref:complement C1q tumor necrosis factor-related protein 2-like n=1 Tax=Ostrea edulis TaxID=37623 RepID=UPI00209425C7|nr:complement C1q tumor necrosis factor-related protein 2-like [Ostrea edulis]
MLLFPLLLMLFGSHQTLSQNVPERTSSWQTFRDDYLWASQTCYTLGFVKGQKENNLKEIIAFDASLSSTMKGMKNGQRVVFSEVSENMGGGYNSSDGVFTVPGSGVYVFQWTTVAQSRGTQTALVVNGKLKAVNECNTREANNDSCTRIAIMRLWDREKVWIECKMNDSVINDYKSSSFTGFRL